MSAFQDKSESVWNAGDERALADATEADWGGLGVFWDDVEAGEAVGD